MSFKTLYCCLLFALSLACSVSAADTIKVESAKNSSTPASAENLQYLINGKNVSKNKYDAARLADEGLALLHANKNQQAAQKLKQAVALAPDLAEAHHSLAVALAKLGSLNDAISEMKTVLSLNPSGESAWMTLAGFYQSNGNIDEALDTYSELRKRFPNGAMRKRVDALILALGIEKKYRDSRQQQDLLLKDSDSTNKNLDGASKSNSSKDARGRDDYLALMMENGGTKRWPRSRMPIKVFIPAASSTPGYRDEFRQILLQSFSAWSKAANGNVTFVFVDKPETANIQCLWTDQIKDLHNPAEAADARLIMDQDGIRACEIWLLTKSVSINTTLSSNDLRLICLHEIGHALGLSGHTTNPEDVMFYSASFKDRFPELSGRDSRSITRLYQNDL